MYRMARSNHTGRRGVLAFAALLLVLPHSLSAQAQRAVATNGVDRFVGNLGTIAQMKPDVLDNFNADEWTKIYSDMLGVPPSLITASDQVAIVRQHRAQAQQQAAQLQAAEQASVAARNLGATPTDGGNAASDVMGMFSQGFGQ